jgi:hypothetical protein
MVVSNKLKILLTLTISLLLLAPGIAAAYTETITDTTLVLPYQGKSPSSYPGWTTWTDVIASTPSAWDVKQVAVTWSGTTLEMQIFTNYPQAGLEGAGQADIALGHDGTFDAGVKMSGTDLGKIYTVSSWVNPQSNPPLSWSNGSWIYGGAYDQAAPKTPDTLIGTGTNDLGTAVVNWVALTNDITAFRIDVIFPDGFNASGLWNNFNFEVGSGSCGNEVMAGTASHAPLPASALLLGTGLVGLVGLRRRRKP